MAAEIIDGKATGAAMRTELRGKIEKLRAGGVTPGLGVVLVGSDPASRSYVTAKERACERLKMHSREKLLPASASREEILAAVDEYNRDPQIHGILVQLPLPQRNMERFVLERIDPDKDVDGFHPVNTGRMLLGQPCFLPCTPHGIINLLQRSGVDPAGRHAVIVGRSTLVGRPLAHLLSRRGPGGDATVTICHSRTPDLARFTRQADILVAAAGQPGLITAGMVKPGAVVVDVGVNRVPDKSRQNGYRLAGDVDFAAVREVAAALTPVPGGVGPMTITMLLYNTVSAAECGGPPR